MPGGGHPGVEVGFQQRVEATARTMLRLAAVRKLPAKAPPGKKRVALYPDDVCAGGSTLEPDPTPA